MTDHIVQLNDDHSPTIPIIYPVSPSFTEYVFYSVVFLAGTLNIILKYYNIWTKLVVIISIIAVIICGIIAILYRNRLSLIRRILMCVILYLLSTALGTIVFIQNQIIYTDDIWTYGSIIGGNIILLIAVLVKYLDSTSYD